MTPEMVQTMPPPRRRIPAQRRRHTSIVRRREVLLLAAIVVIVAASTAAHGYFWTTSNISFMLANSVVTMLLALGESFVMLGRGIDLSVGSIMGMAAIIVGFQVQNHGMSLWPAVLLSAGIGIGLGLGNAILVGIFRLPPIIATLGTLSVYSGLEFVVTNGNQVDNVPNSITNIGNRQVLPGVPELLLVAVPIVLVSAYVLRFTVFGRSLYSAGDDAEAAYRAGIPVQRVLFTTYLIAGLLAGLAGLVFLMRTSGASNTTGAGNDNLNAIAAALIGGVALTGGRGSAFGAFTGAIFLQVTLTAMTFAHVSDVWQPAGVGVLVLLAVLSDNRARSAGAIRFRKWNRRTA